MVVISRICKRVEKSNSKTKNDTVNKLNST
jgi:hypothetical protein